MKNKYIDSFMKMKECMQIYDISNTKKNIIYCRMFVTIGFFGRYPKSRLFSEGTLSCTYMLPSDSVCVPETNP